MFHQKWRREKKHYNERVLNIENGSFTPLVFNINSGMARECKKFFSRLTEMVAEKRNVHVSVLFAHYYIQCCYVYVVHDHLNE